MLTTESKLLVFNICCDHSKYAATGVYTQVIAIVCLPAAPAIPLMAAEEERRKKAKKKASKGHKLGSVLQ